MDAAAVPLAVAVALPLALAVAVALTLTLTLARLPELQKRTYLAKFLMNIEIPEHMFADEEMSEVYQQLKDLTLTLTLTLTLNL